MSTASVLIVDDEPDICELLALTLTRLNLSSDAVHSLKAAQSLLTQNNYAFCLTDMRLPDGDGMDLISYINTHTPNTPVAMITAHGSMDTAIEALKRGAFDFLNKPIDLEQLKSLVNAAIKLPEDNDEKPLLEKRLTGNSEAGEKLRQIVRKVARSQAPVFIHGESGTGKEVCAKTIHEFSSRKNGPFVAVNCGAIPAELVESEFFGHKKGSFTGADRDKTGLFEAASGGTLLLDEVADLPLSMQVKLLRAIQEKSVRPVGSNREISVDVRILSATHKNLPLLVEQNQFRNDLFYRINVIEIHVPPLRERSEDIPVIARQILERITPQQGQRKYALSDRAIEKLSSYTFPGNIRELENTLERTIALCDGEHIDADDLIFQHHSQPPGNETSATAVNHQPGESESEPTQARTFRADVESLDSYLQTIEKEEIVKALNQCRWNKTETAKQLGISFRSLRYRLKKLGLDD